MIDRLRKTSTDAAGERFTPRVTRRTFVAGTSASALAMLIPNALAAQTAPSDELVFSSVMSLSRAIRSKQVSSEEVVRAYLDRIAVVNPKINAVVTLAADRALEEARQADAELARASCAESCMAFP